MAAKLFANCVLRRHYSVKLMQSPKMAVMNVPKAFEGERLDKFLMAHFSMPWPASQKLVRQKKAFIAKQQFVGEEDAFVYRDCAYKLQSGDRICYAKVMRVEKVNEDENESEVKKLDEGKITGMANRLKEMMVFENEHIIVINKDNGVPSQMGTGLSIDNKSEIAVDKLLEAYLINSGLNSSGKLVHRIDRKTSGLLALAKTKEMASWLSYLFRERENSLYKAYYALLCGVPKFSEGIIR